MIMPVHVTTKEMVACFTFPVILLCSDLRTFYLIYAGSQVTTQLLATHTPQVESLTKDPTCVKPIVTDTGDGQSSTQVC